MWEIYEHRDALMKAVVMENYGTWQDPRAKPMKSDRLGPRHSNRLQRTAFQAAAEPQR